MNPGFAHKSACLACGLLVLGAANAETKYAENFSGRTTQLDWKALGYACMTASADAPGQGGAYGGIPKCSAVSDPAGHGALRLTPAATYQVGGILSNFTFPTNQGIQITFTTYTYNGSRDGPAGQGADGIVFMLTDGSAPMPTTVGGSGGSMGYSCANANTSAYQGMTNAYLGLGIDEWGNFLNSADNTNTGIAATTANPWGTGQYQPNRIGLRGAGNTTWAWLQAKNSAYYSGAVNMAKVQAACKTGTYATNASGTTTASIPYNYKAIANGYKVLPNTQKIASNSGKPRVGTVAVLDAKGNPVVEPALDADGKPKLDGKGQPMTQAVTKPVVNAEVWPITYKLSISPGRLLNFSFSYNNGDYQPVLVNHPITNDNGPVPDSFRFGFTAGTGGSHNIHEITCFQVTPAASNSSAGGNTVSSQVQVGSQIYFASYLADEWTGTVRAVPLVVKADSTLALASVPAWDANCMLTGGACASTGKGSGTTNAAGNASPLPLPGGDATGNSRVLLTSDPASGLGVAFRAASPGASALSANVLSWLRGNRSTEQLWGSSPGSLRARTGVLGDIINSSPTWVGPPKAGAYPEVFPGTASPETPHSAYVAAGATRRPVVYAGSNDGFLHGFRTGGADATPDSAGNDGLEVLGFMPSGQLLKYASQVAQPLYSHKYVVDATPGVGDLFYGNQWHTWLVGGVGSAGQEIYALDITEPGNFAESKAANLVMGDWTASAAQLNRLNCTVGKPLVARLHNGQWAILFGNGMPDNSGNCTQRKNGGAYSAGLYIGLVDKVNGAVSFRFLDTKTGASASTANGIVEITALDADGDGVVDYVYGGDIQGNVWRFDLTAADADNWAPSSYGHGSNPTPLFSTPGTQPISTAPVVLPVKTGSVKRMMVYFGTGRLTPAGGSGSATYAAGQQAFYGIWDWDWPAGGPLARLATAPTVGLNALLSQTMTQTSATTRSLPADQAVCWADLASCAAKKQYGWYVNLSAGSGEQIIYNPAMIEGAIMVNTAEPPVIDAQACNPGRQTGWTMAFNPETGGGFTWGFFDIGTEEHGPVAGLYLGGVGSLMRVAYDKMGKGDANDEDPYFVTQTEDGRGRSGRMRRKPPDKPDGAGRAFRVLTTTWRELRQ